MHGKRRDVGQGATRFRSVHRVGRLNGSLVMMRKPGERCDATVSRQAIGVDKNGDIRPRSGQAFDGEIQCETFSAAGRVDSRPPLAPAACARSAVASSQLSAITNRGTSAPT